MKKLKIFLLLSLLLCFGFALSSEVHAQGGGPKIFEVEDILPATTQLEISVKLKYDSYCASGDGYLYIYTNWDEVSDSYGLFGIDIDDVEIVEEEYNDYIYDDFIIDTSEWTIDQRTVTHVSFDLTSGYYITWEDLNAPSGYTITFNSSGGSTIPDIEEVTELPISLPIPTKENHTFVGWYYDSDFTNEALAGDPLTDDVILYARWLPGKLFEVDDVLPATTELKIRILFGQGDYHVETVDRSGIYLSIDWIGGIKDLYVEFDGLVRYDGEVTAYEIDYTIDISDWSLNQRTIKSVSSENGNFVTWEDTTPDGYTQGYLEAREEFGYYDSRTNEWLSVEEYLELYGTDKPGQSDFYGNFDKYFIPAMIIVFGGAIVLTILKVFKGRE